MRHTVNNKFEKREGVRVRNSHANYYYPFTHISKVHLSLRIVAQGNTVAALEGTGASIQLSPTQRRGNFCYGVGIETQNIKRSPPPILKRCSSPEGLMTNNI